jgi:hypothetical protein
VLVVSLVELSTGAVTVIGVDLALQGFASIEQRAIARAEFMHQRIETGPEGLACNPGTGEGLFRNELVKNACHAQAANANEVRGC